ncbi:hypothetical protein Plhal304r1_c101g0174951 [Plasmopara halstedii]
MWQQHTARAITGDGSAKNVWLALAWPREHSLDDSNIVPYRHLEEPQKSNGGPHVPNR